MTRILSVDDEPINLAIIEECLGEDGYQIDEAENGAVALEMVAKNHYDLIILDRMMPKVDGMAVLRTLKADPAWKMVPVIIQTAAASQNEVREGLEAGAHYYLTKPYDPEALRVLVHSILTDKHDRDEMAHRSLSLRHSLNLLSRGEFIFQTLAEAHDLAAALSSLCQEPDSASVGLIELLVNAIEHGNLGITYDEKSELRKNFNWEDEVARRLAMPEYASRKARIALVHQGDELEFTVSDEGAGFDWNKYLDFDPERAFDLNGRGIAMANKFSFSSLQYQGKGNVVVARAQARQG
jgi:CheY-like chemotaxis protein